MILVWKNNKETPEKCEQQPRTAYTISWPCWDVQKKQGLQKHTLTVSDDENEHLFVGVRRLSDTTQGRMV